MSYRTLTVYVCPQYQAVVTINGSSVRRVLEDDLPSFDEQRTTRLVVHLVTTAGVAVPVTDAGVGVGYVLGLKDPADLDGPYLAEADVLAEGVGSETDFGTGVLAFDVNGATTPLTTFLAGRSKPRRVHVELAATDGGDPFVPLTTYWRQQCWAAGAAIRGDETTPVWPYGLKHQTGGLTAPTTGDDSADGYGVGSIWIDTSTSPDTIYVCEDATAGAAVWTLLGLIRPPELVSTTTALTAKAGPRLVLVDVSGASRTITLPSAAQAGQDVTVAVAVPGNLLTVAPYSGQTILGVTGNVDFADRGDGVRLVRYNATTWWAANLKSQVGA